MPAGYATHRRRSSPVRRSALTGRQPAQGWQARFVEARFADGFVVTSPVSVLPQTYPEHPPADQGVLAGASPLAEMGAVGSVLHAQLGIATESSAARAALDLCPGARLNAQPPWACRRNTPAVARPWGGCGRYPGACHKWCTAGFYDPGTCSRRCSSGSG